MEFQESRHLIMTILDAGTAIEQKLEQIAINTERIATALEKLTYHDFVLSVESQVRAKE